LGNQGLCCFRIKNKKIMAGLIPLGAVVDPSRDVFPTTGAHLDVRVIPQFGPQKGKKIDPRTARTLLQNVLIGADKRPLVQQSGSEWKWKFPVTSEFGKRAAPTAGASTYHEGIDIGVGAGTPLTYKGYGTYRPDHGFGALSVADPQGNPYEIRLLHTAPGKAASVGSTVQPSAPVLPSPAQNTDTLMESLFGKQKSLKDVLTASLLQQALARRQETQVDQLSLANPYKSMTITPEQAMQLFA
jgi:hypothetical protein